MRMHRGHLAPRDEVPLAERAVHNRFTDDELKTVISLLAGPGVVWELGFGSWILLQPELINSHAQAVIRSLRDDERELGCIAETQVLTELLHFVVSIALGYSVQLASTSVCMASSMTGLHGVCRADRLDFLEQSRSSDAWLVSLAGEMPCPRLFACLASRRTRATSSPTCLPTNRNDNTSPNTSPA
jgi:hypothetical protein